MHDFGTRKIEFDRRWLILQHKSCRATYHSTKLWDHRVGIWTSQQQSTVSCWRMPRSGSSVVDTRTVLKTYNISSTNPRRWQDTAHERAPKHSRPSRKQNRYSVLQDDHRLVDPDDDAPPRTADVVEDEDDPLGILTGGVFTYPSQSPSSHPFAVLTMCVL